MSDPKISVCLLAHNSEKYICEAIDSVLAQSFSDWEMLISDDASSDGTPDVVRNYLSDKRIRYVYHQENLKQGGNWAYAVEHTLAPYITTLHADDAWETYALDAFSQAFAERQDLDLAWANWDYYDINLLQKRRTGPVTEALQMTERDGVLWLLRHNHALPSAAAFSRRVCVQAGGPDRRYGMLCDREFFLRIASVADYCRALPVVITRYREHKFSVTHDFSTTGKLQNEIVLLAENASQIFRFRPGGEYLVQELQRRLGQELFIAGTEAFFDGGVAHAENLLRKSLQFAGWRVVDFEVAKSLFRNVWYMTRNKKCKLPR
jgi:glycosyltransferase involved in cell wall biosynthesis